MINKNLVTLKVNYLADTMQSELIKKTIWSNVSIVSYNIPLLAMLSIYENISLPLQYFENVKQTLDNLGIEYKIDSSIVRGLDYYTKTVFEFIDENTGLTVLGGGRYDGLIEELGGQKTPAVGFATGVERLMEMYNSNNKDVKDKIPNLYIVSNGIEENKKVNIIYHTKENADKRGVLFHFYFIFGKGNFIWRRISK